jgi:hypothetical protein
LDICLFKLTRTRGWGREVHVLSEKKKRESPTSVVVPGFHSFLFPRQIKLYSNSLFCSSLDNSPALVALMLDGINALVRARHFESLFKFTGREEWASEQSSL